MFLSISYVIKIIAIFLKFLFSNLILEVLNNVSHFFVYWQNFIIDFSKKTTNTVKKLSHSERLQRTANFLVKDSAEISMLFIGFRKKRKNPTTQSLSDEQPIFSTKIQQKFTNIYHWFQQKPKNRQFSAQSFCKNVQRLPTISAKTTKQQKSCYAWELHQHVYWLSSKNFDKFIMRQFLNLLLGF